MARARAQLLSLALLAALAFLAVSPAFLAPKPSTEARVAAVAAGMMAAAPAMPALAGEPPSVGEHWYWNLGIGQLHGETASIIFLVFGLLVIFSLLGMGGSSRKSSSAILIDALLGNDKELAVNGRCSVQVLGVRSHLFINKKKFRILQDALRQVRRSESGGALTVELDLGASAYDSDAGTLRIVFPPFASLGTDEAWAIHQFESDIQLSVNGAKASKSVVRATLESDAVPWLADVKFAGGRAAGVVCLHPEPVLEHEGVSAVALPALGALNLSLPVQLVTQGLISEPQLQAVCYAAKAFRKFIPSDPPTAGGFLLGDGTGCGKGRVIAALLLHVSTRSCGTDPADLQAELARRRRQGRHRRCLWVSTSRDLARDAERDLADLGADAQGLHIRELSELRNAKASDPEASAANVMFTTYAMLRKLETAKYIANWLGGDLAEGLIVFDEAHSAKNFVNSREGTSTMQGKMVDYLQQTCPKAPVLYASATACTEVSEMGYMPRLGLWGPGQSFGDFQGFRRAVEAKGIEGMEAVALQLKSLGVATCRSLSHEGARLAVCKAPLEPDRSEVYDRACGFFARLHSEAQAALAETWE
ncbi:unnamed protein product, partial [Polarella glacialis]